MKVFISYAREDLETAKKIHNDLKRRGINSLIDFEIILPGQNWKAIINNAIKECSFFLALLSSNSLTKRGYVQSELKLALDILKELPTPYDIFIIPIRLEECNPSDEKLSELHWIDIFSSYEDGINNIFRVLFTHKVQPDILPVGVFKTSISLESMRKENGVIQLCYENEKADWTIEEISNLNGYYGYTVPWTTDWKAEASKRFGTFEVEIHHLEDGQVYVIAFVTQSSINLLMDPLRKQKIKILLAWKPIKTLTEIVAIPTNRVLSLEERDDYYSMTVL